ncbi:MAG TPA: endo alpha-1,4 polygalactosaminidase [Actinomycetota bacterium]|nr:endo alpha-1,4 polygalactosaminidase [Actinomycetota bacterium]
MRRFSIAMAVAALVLCLVPAGAQASGAGGRAQPHDGTIPPPVATGTLAIGGFPQDGRTVSAVDVTWRPPALPTGYRLLSFNVANVWEACATPHGPCVPGADTTATPFAAGCYVVGHADTGSYLRVIETATEVVQTEAVPFTFKVVHASQRATFGSKTVAAYPAGVAPSTRFVNGTPEPRTGSTSENFQVQAPHYATSDGVPDQEYQVDAGPWTPVPSTEVFPTGTLGLGTHSVRVRVSNAAGSRTISYSWQVVPLPAPVSCVSTSLHTCWFPPHLDSTGHPMRWDWQIGLTTPLERTGASAVDIYDIDGFLTTPAELGAIHTQWQAATLPHPKAICYLDLAWEDYRPDGSTFQYGGLFPGSALGNVYFGYPQERWVDFRQLAALTPMLDARMAMCAAKGFDSIEFDDIQPARSSGFNLTSGDIQNYLASTFNTAHRLGLTVLWKNNGTLSWWGRQYSDGAIVEECYVYHECFSSWVAGSTHGAITCTTLSGPTPCGWDDFTTDVTPQQPTGKWVGEAEYKQDRVVCDPGQPCRPHREFSTYCSIVYGRASGFAAVKFDVDLDGSLFYPCPNGT